MNTFPNFLMLAGLATLFVSPALAIDPHRAMSQYVRARWGTEQGFPLGPVYAITQTADGYLWIGTGAGLVRFDGLHFVLVQDPSRTFAFSGVIGLEPDTNGGLWLRLRDETLLHYYNGEFSKPFSDPAAASDISAMSRTRRGELLAAKGQRGALTYRGHALAVLAPAAGMPRSPVTAMVMTPDDSIWLGTRGNGLFQLKAGATTSFRRGLPDPKIDCLLPDGDKELWIGTDMGLAKWNGLDLTTQGMPALLAHSQILTLAKDGDGNLWIGTDSKGLLRLNADGVMPLDSIQSEMDNAITALFEDREGNMWIGSADGIERLSDSPFVTYSSPEGLPTDGGSPLFVDAGSRTWFAPVEGGLWWFKNGHNRSIREAGLPNDIIYSIAGGGGDLWVGRQRGGLTRLRLEGEALAAQTYTKADGLAQNSVYSVYLTRAGVVWAGTLSAGVSKLDHGTFTTYNIVDGLASNTVASILETKDGAMWFATPTGLSSLVNNQWRTFTTAQGLPSENINCLLEDSTGVLWAGTTAGLTFRTPSGFAVPVRAPVTMREQTLGVVEDPYGFLWIATANHVLRVHRERLLHGNLGDGDFISYGLFDGLRGAEGVKRHRSVITDSLHRIWMSLNGGIAVVDPEWLSGRSFPGIPQIQTVAADGVSIPTNGQNIHVPAARQRMVFSYAGLSLSVPERVHFRYRLDGFDHGWSEPVAEREAVYTNLGPGPYRFRVSASNPNGVWTDREATFSFAVDPEWWQRWWFLSAIAPAFLLAVAAFYRLRLRQATGRLNVRFEERLAERTRIAQELHDTLLQGFISASMQVHVAAGRLPGDSQVKPALGRSLELMRQVIDEGRNAVRGLRSTPGASMDLEKAFSQLRDEVCAHDDAVEFRVISQGQQKNLHPLLRDEVYSIGREALLNAFRHSGAKTIEIELRYSSRRLLVAVRDNGRGIDAKTLRTGLDGHWGLVGMRERADRIGAKLRLWSSPNHGTEIELTVPGHVAFQELRKESRPSARQIQ